MAKIQKRQAYESDVILGEEYQDTQTKISGHAVGIYFYQHGCDRVELETVNNDGDVRSYVFDSPRLVHVKTQVQATTTRTGGPSKGMTTRPTPGRR